MSSTACRVPDYWNPIFPRYDIKWVGQCYLLVKLQHRYQHCSCFSWNECTQVLWRELPMPGPHTVASSTDNHNPQLWVYVSKSGPVYSLQPTWHCVFTMSHSSVACRLLGIIRAQVCDLSGITAVYHSRIVSTHSRLSVSSVQNSKVHWPSCSKKIKCTG